MEQSSVDTLKGLYDTALMKLLSLAATAHQQHHEVGELETCCLLSVKTGSCSEDCAYCSQSIHHSTSVLPHQLLDEEKILAAAHKSKELGATHFCLSTSGREVRSEKDFSLLLRMVEKLTQQGIRVCSTLGLLTEEKAQKLKAAGLYAYNHNLDTGPKYYPKIITTRTYQDRLDTIEIVQKSGLKICSGLILGMGESLLDRFEWLLVLKNLKRPPDFIPVNVLIPHKGTPLENQPPIPFWDVLKMIALIRLSLPKTKIRFAAGRGRFTFAEQTLCLMAGVNSFHIGEKLLTVSDCKVKDDQLMIDQLNLNMI